MVLTEEDIQFLEDFYTPVRNLECLFHDFDNFGTYKKDSFGNIRVYQMPMISDETLIDFDLTAEQLGLDEKQKFKLQKNVGDLYCFGARKFGKTKSSQELDILNHMIATDKGIQTVFSSVDLKHLKQVLDGIKLAFSCHPFLSLFKVSLKGAPDYQFVLKNGYCLISVNFNLTSTSPGSGWIGLHVRRVLIDEASLETDDVYDKRKDAVSELGAVHRHTGMTDYLPNSPAGKVFNKIENKKHVLNYPQFVNPFWDDQEKKDRIEEYGGEHSLLYQIFVLGRVVDNGQAAIDMKRVREFSYMLDNKGNFTKQIKRFELEKNNFKFYKSLIVVERPENIDKLYLATDVGKHVTEFAIFCERDGVFEYLYNITLNGLIQQEIEEILRYLYALLDLDYIAIDCGDGEGRGIYSGLELELPVSKLVYYDGSMKLKVGFEYEENESDEKTIKIENGLPVYKYENMAEFSVRHLKDILYSGKIRIPEDHKFDNQAQKVIATFIGGKIIYKCVCSQGDHLWDTFKVFSIAHWMKKDFNENPEEEQKTEWGTGATN